VTPVEIIGVPFDRCGKQLGSALGPEAVRFALRNELDRREDMRAWVQRYITDKGNVAWEIPDHEEMGLRSFGESLNCYSALFDAVTACLSHGNRPVLIGGDHSTAIGSVGAAHAHVLKKGGKLGVLWIDAHADLNTPATSGTGNVHGMPLGLLTGETVQNLPDHHSDRWKNLGSELAGKVTSQWEILGQKFAQTPLKDDQLAWIGLRDVDPAEARFIADMKGCFATSMQDIDHHTLPKVLQAFRNWLIKNKITDLWISLDVDSLDPVLAPGTGTAVRGGLTYREGHLLAELLHEMLDDDNCPHPLLGLEVVEVNPMLDSANETAKIAIEWVASLAGRKILSRRPAIDF
jgi:arginase